MKNALLAIFLIIIGGSLIVVFGLQFVTSGAIKETIEHNKEYKKSFEEAALKVDAFAKTNNRLPNADEFKSIDDFMTINSSASPYPKEWESPPKDGYYLARWTGDNDEFYASWNNKTTLNFDEDSYYLFHSKLLTQIMTIVGLVLCGFGTSKLKRAGKIK